MLDIEAQLAQAEVSVVNGENDLALSLLNLSQALNIENPAGFDIAEVDIDAFSPVALAGIPSAEGIYQTALGIKPSVKEAELRLQSSEYQVKIAQSARYPQLSLSANAGAGYMYMFGQNFPQQTLAEQIRNRHSESVAHSSRFDHPNSIG